MSRWVYPLMEVGNMKGSCLKFPIVDSATDGRLLKTNGNDESRDMELT